MEDVAEDADEVWQLPDRRCKHCGGKGTRVTYETHHVICSCVFRAMFRECLAYFRSCYVSGFGIVSLEHCSGPCGRRLYSRKQEEYVADFDLVSRRVLNDQDYLIFRSYFLLGMDWSSCASKMGMNRGNFFHADRKSVV